MTEPKFSLFLPEFKSLFPDEEAARSWVESPRGPDGPTSSGCGGVNTATWLPTWCRWQCREKGCRCRVAVKSNTPMHRSHLPLLVWPQAMFLLVSSSKGISSMKPSEMLGIPCKPAWHLSHRIREMMATDNGTLFGTSEGHVLGQNWLKRLIFHNPTLSHRLNRLLSKSNETHRRQIPVSDVSNQ